MSKGDTFENDLMKLLFQGTTIANIADNAASSPLATLYFGLHTADPAESGNQTTSECTYTPYARVGVARSAAGFTVTANSVSPVADVDFPICSSGSETATHFSIGTAASGSGKILYSGTLTPNIVIAATVPPTIRKESTVTED
ncbi:hypothetical protein JQ574_22755 [Bradyrhizobium sp. AUGA SZCCT0158]|uniref:phage tail fiber protein n=1 Tax=Bradyrhizobium sp. AUGA SZCCT0158 TaxID=2807661 RepID=UPI001BAA681F|nr:hypothetical protein [Bradyrhizobium sp. AUGA SZCCT0158]MBR1198821.1 hypothetical protein [Bradyrhizobium sp. AUGA SZCCT0158]